MTSTLPEGSTGGRRLQPRFWSKASGFRAVPDVEGDGHDGVEDNDVGPEREEGGETGVVAVRSRQERREVGASVGLPEVVSYCQNAAHEDQKPKNLQGERRGGRTVWVTGSTLSAAVIKKEGN